ncbi:MAG: hypothetical protein OXC00_10585 [Acidimicrobiaceae bacterium]|nr:hypothetical protein [Acidimicrobiaceae bacterium]
MPSLSEYADVLPQGTIDAWPVVASILPEGSALMGGTGLAVWLRHRLSADLDIFTPVRFDTASVLAALSAAGDFVHVESSERTIRGTLNSVNVDIVAEDGAHGLGPPLTISGLCVASLQDIAAGKLKALADRKQLRDYVDAMFIETKGRISLEQGVMLYFRRYGLDLHPADVNRYLRHLLDFSHLEDDPAIREAFGDGIRERVEHYFRSRQPELIAAFHQLLTGAD